MTFFIQLTIRSVVANFDEFFYLCQLIKLLNSSNMHDVEGYQIYYNERELTVADLVKSYNNVILVIYYTI